MLDKSQNIGYNIYEIRKERWSEMAKINKTQNDKSLRDLVFSELFEGNTTKYDFVRINDRQYGVLLIDLNGHQRYVRIGAIVAEERDDMTAEELMQSEIDAYNAKQEAKAEKAIKKEAKIAKDKARREAEKAKKEAEEEQDDPNQFLPHEVTY